MVELTGDQACFPADITAMEQALGAADRTTSKVAGTHFGRPITKGAPTGMSLAAAQIGAWLGDRVPAAQPAL